jgi:signal transduction histidine kinase
MTEPDRIDHRYQDLQSYVAWTDEDAARVRVLGPILEPHLPGLVRDFYAEIARHPGVHKVWTGGPEHVERLERTLLAWLGDLLTGPYDRDYVARRWEVGARHVESGLDRVYANAALSRLRDGLVRHLAESWTAGRKGLAAAIRSLNKLLDLELATVEDAYQAESITRIQSSERLASLGQIAGGIAHEIRDALNVIKCSHYYLNAAGDPPLEKRAKHLQRIERNMRQAEQAIATLTNFARVAVPELQPFAVEPAIHQALADSALPDGVDVEVACANGLPPALADPCQIRMALSNLIRNACDAMPSGGRLTLRGRPHGDRVEIAVIDTGVGITAADLGRIAEPLYSTKALGLGLGLTLVRLILERNGGSLAVASEPGWGSTFAVRLACAHREEPTS